MKSRISKIFNKVLSIRTKTHPKISNIAESIIPFLKNVVQEVLMHYHPSETGCLAVFQKNLIKRN